MKPKTFNNESELNEYLFANLKKSLILITELLPYVHLSDAPGAGRRYNKAYKYALKMANEMRRNK